MLIKVRVYPSSKKEEITRKSKDNFEIKIREKPERGEANKKVFDVLASFFKIPKNKIRLIKGHRQKNKIFEITD